MWELDNKKGWALKNWCLWTVVLEKTSESPLHKEVKSVSLKGHQPWIFTGRTDAEAETPVFWSSNVNRWLIGKYPDAGKDWSREENEMTEDEMVRWHHQLDRPEFEQAPGVGDGQESLVCCSPWGHSQIWLTDWTIYDYMYFWWIDTLLSWKAPIYLWYHFFVSQYVQFSFNITTPAFLCLPCAWYSDLLHGCA